MIEVTQQQYNELTKWADKKYCLEAVKQNGSALSYVKEQTEAICLEAVKQNGDALQYVKEQTEAICLEAVKQNGYALRYVDIKFLTIKDEPVVKKCDKCGHIIS